MKMLKKNLLFILTLLFALTVSAQESVPSVQWRFNVKMTSATEGEVIMKATLAEGWHLYGTKIPANGPKPTIFDFAGSEGVTFISELTASIAPVKIHDDMFGMDLTWWDSDVTFRRKFKVTNPSNAVIAGKVVFMSCNKITCAPPSTQNFSIKVKK